MSLLFVFLASYCAGVITLIFSFGLNVMLVPVLAIFIPIHLAIAFTGVNFVLYNSIRVAITWRYISWKVVLKFTPLAIIGVIIGGALLNYALIVFKPKTLEIIMGIMLLAIVFLELFKVIEKLKLNNNIFLFAGGFISGFAGGLIGSQGPFRVSALLNLKLNYQTFLATNAVLGLIIDGFRVICYFFTFLHFSELFQPIMLVTILGSILGFLTLYKFTKYIKMEKLKPLIIVLIVGLVGFMIFS